MSQAQSDAIYNQLKSVLPTDKHGQDPRLALQEARDIAARGAALALYGLLELAVNTPTSDQRGEVADETRRKAAVDLLKFATGECLGAPDEPPGTSSLTREQLRTYGREHGGPQQ